MIAAVKAFKGELPRSYSGDGSDPDRLKIRSTAEETKHIFRARILNPKWIESMKRHVYKGAADPGGERGANVRIISPWSVSTNDYYRKSDQGIRRGEGGRRPELCGAPGRKVGDD